LELISDRLEQERDLDWRTGLQRQGEIEAGSNGNGRSWLPSGNIDLALRVVTPTKRATIGVKRQTEESPSGHAGYVLARRQGADLSVAIISPGQQTAICFQRQVVIPPSLDHHNIRQAWRNGSLAVSSVTPRNHRPVGFQREVMKIPT